MVLHYQDLHTAGGRFRAHDRLGIAHRRQPLPSKATALATLVALVVISTPPATVKPILSCSVSLANLCKPLLYPGVLTRMGKTADRALTRRTGTRPAAKWLPRGRRLFKDSSV